MSGAFQALLVYAQLLGAAPAAAPAAVPAARAAVHRSQPQEVLRIPLAEIVAQQGRLAETQRVGRGFIALSAALDPKAGVWIKLSQNGGNAAFPLGDLDAGADVDFPVERYHALAESGTIRVYPIDPPQEPQARAAAPDLLRALVDAAEHVQLAPNEYAVVYEDGRQGVPASLSLIREDLGGGYHAKCYAAAELALVSWFQFAGGVAYGVKIDGGDLVFVSESRDGAAGAAAL